MSSRAERTAVGREVNNAKQRNCPKNQKKGGEASGKAGKTGDDDSDILQKGVGKGTFAQLSIEGDSQSGGSRMKKNSQEACRLGLIHLQSERVYSEEKNGQEHQIFRSNRIERRSRRESVEKGRPGS